VNVHVWVCTWALIGLEGALKANCTLLEPGLIAIVLIIISVLYIIYSELVIQRGEKRYKQYTDGKPLHAK